MTSNASRARVGERLSALLTRNGPSSAAELTRELGISQPTFSRLVKSLHGQVRTLGRGRATRYFAPREIPDVHQPVSIYEARPRGDRLRRFGEMRATGERGFVVTFADGSWQFFVDLPWFLQDARPSGFLGRLMPKRHPELGLPPDIRLWSGDHVLRFSTRVGWDLPGAFIIGDDACNRFLEQVERPSHLIDAAQRLARYPAIARDLLSFGPGGSSAAGEQPKFLATRQDADRLTPVLVKFSPPTNESVGRRVADLLIAEHTAMLVLRDNGIATPTASILSSEERVFFEVERFDREDIAHRIGQVCLESLDMQFAGTDMTSWTVSVVILAAKGMIPTDVVPRVCWLETFGRIIGNTDMHFGNLAFVMDGTNIIALSPAYDMVPMYYHPRQAEIPAGEHPLPGLGPEIADVAGGTVTAAIDFWTRLSLDKRISRGFRDIARVNIRRTGTLRRRVAALPAGTTG